MLAEGSSRLYTEWLAYWQLEPFGEWRADMRSANQIAHGLNVWRKKGASPLDMMQFVLFPLGGKREPFTRRSSKWIEQRLRAFGEQMNAVNAETRRRIKKSDAITKQDTQATVAGDTP